jgi:SPP1 family predicted phage head-tail adaptor
MLPRRLSNNVSYVSAGSMTERVALLTASQSKDADGEFVQAHELVATVWGRVDALTSKYIEKPESVTTEATHKVTIRWMPGITSANLVQLSDGRIFDIQAALDPDERKVNLALYCYERV